MLVRNIGRATKLNNLKAGNLFSAEIRDKMCLCIAVEASNESGLLDAVVLFPGHPQLDGAPGLLANSVFSQRVIFAYDNAEIRYSPELGAVIPANYNLEVADKPLFLLNSNVYIHFIHERWSEKTVNLLTGKYEEVNRQEAMYAAKWHIVWKDEAGISYPICTFKAADPSKDDTPK
ncbi:hypothetical protein IPV08_23440 [Methylobacterium sp. SD274]|uniref:hypothetical protein n=1 Tax=Methylobacterium sp. SD274 TaxID=2782009 RepID=UPI001A962B4B|nr:hypothetical protein [Methylobacterium sp. SD274]MBO1022915.1 hypothetical protein [Methylobacterium sp. SD274]